MSDNDPKWTEAQRRAIRTTGVNLLISAAAGSGKTAVLAERCAHLVCEADDPCGVDELLVVTFTEAAAAEMKSRIEKALRNKLERPDAPDDPKLARQLALVERAQISTLHGFCSRLLRQHFHLVGLDPNFGVLDADEAKLLRQETARELFADRYDNDDGGEFQSLVDVYGDGNDEPLMDRVIHTHELLQSIADPKSWVAAARARSAEAAEKPLNQTSVGRELATHLRAKLEDLKRRAEEGLALLRKMPAFARFALQLADLKAVIERWGNVFAEPPARPVLRAVNSARNASSQFSLFPELFPSDAAVAAAQSQEVPNFDALAEAINAFELPKKPVLRNTPGKAAAAAALDVVRNEMSGKARKKSGSLLNIARFTTAEWSEGLRRTRGASDLFLDLVEEFGIRYRDAKQVIRKVDFSDLEVLTLQVLTAPESRTLAPSGAARAYQRQFKHVLVDEYQDINEVQDAILRLVSREGAAAKNPGVKGNLFCVGDVKQSIYGFRLAEPARFLERDRMFRESSEAKPTAPSRGASPRAAQRSALESASRTGATRPGSDAPGAVGQVIDLQSNFRSREPLIGSLNALFERLMTTATAGINYDAAHKLMPGATYPDAGAQSCFTGAPIELHVLPPGSLSGEESASEDEDDPSQEPDRAEREAAFIAQRIHEMMGHSEQPRKCVLRKNEATGEKELQPIRYRDIVILLRSLRFKADQFADILTQHGIPTHRDTGVGYFSTVEVRDVLALLRVLDNQQQDIPLAAVLRSPIARLPDAEDALAKIVLEYRNAPSLSPELGGESRGEGSDDEMRGEPSLRSGPSPQPCPLGTGGRGPESMSFHQAVVAYAAEQVDDLASFLQGFLIKLARWRELAHQRPLAELIWTLYTETGYLAYCSGLENGEQRVANLVYLHERARQFGSFARQGLYRFLTFLQSLESESDLGAPSVLSEADDVVRVMSVHRSKGLEFPVVFLPDLGKRINMSGCSGSILVDRHAYLGFAVPDEEKRIRYPSLASVLVQARLRNQAMAEELRVLYVAATRAREHLVLVGTADAKKVDQWQSLYVGRAGALPAETVLGAGSMLDWVGPVAASLSGKEGTFFQIVQHSPEDVHEWKPIEPTASRLSRSQEMMAHLAPLSPAPPADAVADGVVQRLTRVYDRAPYTKLVAQLSVTAWAKHGKPMPMLGDAEEPKAAAAERALPLPRALETVNLLSATDLGTATHLALEHLNFARPCAGADLDEQITRLVQRNIMRQPEADAVDRDAIAWFISSTLGQRVRTRAAGLLREMPFHLAVAPERWMDVPPSALPADQIMLRGRIDLVIPEQDGLIVVDYKTDRVQGAALEERAVFYKPQVALYREALEKITGRKVTGVYLVFLAARVVKNA